VISENVVSNILKNRRYLGEYIFRDIVIPNGIPRIVPQELFDRVQERMATNKKAPARYKADEEYLLSTKLFCGKCQRMMAGESGKRRDETVYRYYKCSGVKRKLGCDKKTVRKAWIEDVVVDETARGLHIGQTLVERAKEEAIKLGAKKIYLTSNPSRKAAHALYNKCGFEEYDTTVFRVKG
jgi:GNAT superfamily N-acetyltransferase